MGRGALPQRAHPDDPDQRGVALRWDGIIYALLAPPNNAGRHQHLRQNRSPGTTDLRPTGFSSGAWLPDPP